MLLSPVSLADRYMLYITPQYWDEQIDLVMKTTRRCVKNNASAIANLRISVLLYSDVVVREHVSQTTSQSDRWSDSLSTLAGRNPFWSLRVKAVLRRWQVVYLERPRDQCLTHRHSSQARLPHIHRLTSFCPGWKLGIKYACFDNSWNIVS
jgi:hypothetical protein